MYTEGLQIGENSYVLSDESGNMILLSAKGTPEEVERYLKLENDYDEKLDEKSEIQSTIQNINNKEVESKKANIEIIITLFLLEGIFLLCGLSGVASPVGTMQLLGFPIITMLGVAGIFKPIMYGTKKGRAKRRKEANNKLVTVLEELKQIDKEKRKLKDKIEYENYFPEEEIIPVTTTEKTKANVKMRILRLDKNTIYENIN